VVKIPTKYIHVFTVYSIHNMSKKYMQYKHSITSNIEMY